MEPRIVIVDDEPHIRSAILEIFLHRGWECKQAENGYQAQQLLSQEPFDLVLTDIRMPVMDGLTLLDWTLSSGPGVPVVLMTAHGDVSQAVQALQRGAADYVTKPFEFDELLERVQRALRGRSGWTKAAFGSIGGLEPFAFQRNQADPKEIDQNQWYLPRDGAMGKVLQLALKAAPTDSTVLLTGESGTGKEVVARYIHAQSLRRNGPFIPVNLGAIPETLIESELFGHEKGAFSGALVRKIGYFEAAQRGTIFLDEIGELPIQLQVTLLRVLQERTIVRVGSTTQVPLDVRIIAASNRNLQGLVREGTFRQDLFYRIQVLHVSLPPLRERRKDIPLLAQTLLPKLGKRMAVQGVPEIDPSAMNALLAYDFPGNVRELENMLERGLILAEPVLGKRIIQIKDLGIDVKGTKDSAGSDSLNSDSFDSDLPMDDTLEAWERKAIQRALEKTEHNRTKAAELLGISRRNLQDKIKLYQL